MFARPMRVELLDFTLPEAAIAQAPAATRDAARLLVLGGDGEPDRDLGIRDLASLVPSGALVVLNDTKVLKARLLGTKVPSGGRAEIMLLRRLSADAPRVERWEALGRASKPVRPGARLAFGSEIEARVVARDDAAPGAAILEVEIEASPRFESVADALEAVGALPLPPYVRRAAGVADDERYQTVFAREPGAVAAPTAGLHLTGAMLAELRARGVELATVTLHVGLGTFQPVVVDDLDAHPMHAESWTIPESTAEAVERARARGAPIVAVGTTVVRTLESAAAPDGVVRAGQGTTRLLIQPGYDFRVVDALLTNFHLPRSTLLALVAAFAGRERVLAAYAGAVARGYRFFSYGDAMWIGRRMADGGAP